MTSYSVKNKGKRSVSLAQQNGHPVKLGAGETKDIFLFGRHAGRVLRWERAGLLKITESGAGGAPGSASFATPANSGLIPGLL